MTKKKKQNDVLTELLASASPEVLRDLIMRLTVSRPDVRRECFTYSADLSGLDAYHRLCVLAVFLFSRTQEAAS